MLTDKAFRKGLNQLLKNVTFCERQFDTGSGYVVVFGNTCISIYNAKVGITDNSPIFNTDRILHGESEFYTFIEELHIRNIKTEIYDYIEAQLLLEM